MEFRLPYLGFLSEWPEKLILQKVWMLSKFQVLTPNVEFISFHKIHFKPLAQNFWSKEFLAENFFLVLISFSPKEYLVQKILCQKKLWKKKLGRIFMIEVVLFNFPSSSYRSTKKREKISYTRISGGLQPLKNSSPCRGMLAPPAYVLTLLEK